MDFFESQDRARRKTGWLVFYFFLALATMNAAIYLAVVAIVSAGRGRPTLDWWQPQVLLVVLIATSAVIALGSLVRIIQLRYGGGASVATMLGGQQISPGTTNRAERRLLNVVEEMALASGVPVPPVYVLDDERSINAFAAGFTPGDAVIGVNRGTLQYLSREELQGVIAHEFSHILHGDMRLNIKLIGLLNGILLLSTIGYYFMRFGGGGYHSSRRDKNGGHLALIGLAVFVIGYIGLFFARLIKAAIARQREYLADASAVQYTRNPAGLGGALKKIGGLATGSRMTTPEAETASHMFFGSFRESWFQSFSTHPPLLERIRLLDPNFDGEYPAVEEPTPQRRVRSAEKPSRPGSPFGALEKALPTDSIPIVGDSRIPLDPAILLATIGTPTTDHVAVARQLIGSLPAEVKAALHEPFSARLVVLALLLDDREPVRSDQLRIVEQKLGEASAAGTAKLKPLVAGCGKGVRLPMIEIAQATLGQLSPEQYRQLRETVEALVHADEQVDLFEFTILRTLLTRLDRQYRHLPPPQVRYLALRAISNETADLLSVLAYVGHADDAVAAAAFDLASRAFPSDGPLQLLPRDRATLARLHAALDKLVASSPVIKRHVIRAASLAVASDGQVTAAEAELLRAIADSLDCPVPPLYAGSVPASQ